MMLKRALASTAACCLMLFLGSVSIASAEPPVIDRFNWVNNDPVPATPTVGMLGWAASGGGDYEQRDECDVDMTGSCEFFPGAGPLIRAGAPGTYPAGSKAEWIYTVPGGADSYVKEVTAVAGNIQMSATPTEPHAYVGLWNGSSWTEFDSTDEEGSVALEDVEGGEDDRQVKFGLASDTTTTATDEQWAALAAMQVELGDEVTPELLFDEDDIPSGWVNEDPILIPIEATDEGLGIQHALVLGSKRSPSNPWAGGGSWGDGFSPGCVGTTESPCPAASPNGYELEIRPAELREGETSLTMASLDPNWNVSNDGMAYSFDIKVDTFNPKVNLSGSFTSAPGMVLSGPSYTLNTDATDGETGKINSGVVDIKVLVDDVVIDSKSAPCATENCEMDLETEIEPGDYSNGEHLLKVKVTDGVGHVRTRITDFEVAR